MASGGGFEEEVMSEEYSRSLSIHVNHCDPCQDDDIQIEAEGFCIECIDYLCSDCYEAHKKNRASRHHVLQDRIYMPASKPSQVETSEKCLIHENESIKWYCKSHDVTLCNLCKAAQHRKCNDLKAIADISASIFNSAEFTSIKGQLTRLKEEFTKNLNEVKENTSEVESIYNRVLEEITRRLTDIRDKDLDHLKSLEASCDASLKTVTGLCTKLDSLENKDGNEQAFLTIRKVESQLKSFDETLKLTKDDNEISKYQFVPSPSYIKSGLIGTLCETRYRRTPVKLEDINVKTSSDTDDCCITGMDRLDDNRLVVADFNKRKLKLVDMTSKIVTEEIKLDVSPWNLARIDDKNIAVTTFGNQKIVFVSVTDRLCVHKTIDKSNYKYCQGIVYDHDSLIVSYHDPDQIEILDLDGTVKHTIDSKDKDGTVRFGDVEYIAKNPDTDILYLSDWSNHKILSMTRDGKIMSSFSRQRLIGPTGITVGRDDRIFVCSRETHKIYELSSDLSKSEIILDEQNEIKCPRSIVYDDVEYKLYIGSANNNNIQVFLV